MLAAKQGRTSNGTSSSSSAVVEAPWIKQQHDSNGGGNGSGNEPIVASRLLVKALRALEVPEGEGSAAHEAGPAALLAALEGAVERRVGELPPGYLAAEEGLVKGE